MWRESTEQDCCCNYEMSERKRERARESSSRSTLLLFPSNLIHCRFKPFVARKRCERSEREREKVPFSPARDERSRSMKRKKKKRIKMMMIILI